MVNLAKSRLSKILLGAPENSFRGRFIKGINSILDRLGTDIILKRSREKIPTFVLDDRPRIRKPRYDPISLWEAWQHSWILGAINRAISQEVLRNHWHNVPKFKVKCEKCGYEYAETVEQCHCGSKNLRAPDSTQKVLADRLTSKPNPDYNFEELLRSIIEYELALANWYLEIGYQNLKNLKQPAELYVTDARFTYPVADAYGHLGNNEYFCPNCWDKRIEQFNLGLVTRGQIDEWIDVKQAFMQDFKCQKCGAPLLRTCYVSEVGGAIQTRWDKTEIVHGSMTRVLPRLFGVSKLVKLYKVNETIRNMDDYNYEVYGEGKIGRIIQLPGYDEHEIAEIKTRLQQELQKLNRRDVQTGAVRENKKIRVVMMGGKRGAEPFVEIPFMPDLAKMQSTEFYDRDIFAICSSYGVQPIFMTFAERGQAGTTSPIRVRVMDRTTKDHQGYLESVFNDRVYPIFGITDWRFEFKQLEERDRLREEQIEHTRAATALTFLRGGFKVMIGENGELVVSGEGKIPEGARVREQEPRTRDEDTPIGVASTRPEAETRESERTGELVQRVVRFPISWNELTHFEAFDKTYEIVGDREEVYLAINGVEMPETRLDARNFHYAIAMLVDAILSDIRVARVWLSEEKQEEFKVLKESWIKALRREYKGEILQSISNFLEEIHLSELAKKFDNLRDRLDKQMPSSFEEQHVE